LNYIPNIRFGFIQDLLVVILHLPFMFCLDKVMNMWIVSSTSSEWLCCYGLQVLGFDCRWVWGIFLLFKTSWLAL